MFAGVDTEDYDAWQPGGFVSSLEEDDLMLIVEHLDAPPFFVEEVELDEVG